MMGAFEDFLRDHYRVIDKGTDELRINCPLCDDTKFHGYANIVKGVYHCFKCNGSPRPGSRGYTVYQFLTHIHGLTSRTAIRIIKDDFTDLSVINSAISLRDARERLMDDFEEDEVLEKEISVDLPKSFPIIPNDTSVIGRHAWRYLRRRLGEDAELWCGLFNIRYCTDGQYSRRLIFPIGSRGKLLYFQARTFFPPNSDPKYLNPPVDDKPLFFPFPKKSSKELIVCEGYLDALMIGEDSAAILGSSASGSQIRSMRSLKYGRIIVCLDDDEAGVKGAFQLCEDLRREGETVWIVPGLGGKDPCSLGPKARKTIKSKAVLYTLEVYADYAMEVGYDLV